MRAKPSRNSPATGADRSNSCCTVDEQILGGTGVAHYLPLNALYSVGEPIHDFADGVFRDVLCERRNGWVVVGGCLFAIVVTFRKCLCFLPGIAPEVDSIYIVQVATEGALAFGEVWPCPRRTRQEVDCKQKYVRDELSRSGSKAESFREETYCEQCNAWKY